MKIRWNGLIYCKCLFRSQQQRLDVKLLSAHSSDFIRQCCPKSQVFGPKTVSWRSVYPWCIALTVFTETHSSTEQLTLNKIPQRSMMSSVFNYRKNRASLSFSSPPTHSGSHFVSLYSLAKISVSVYLPPLPSPAPLQWVSWRWGPSLRSSRSRSALSTEPGCLLPAEDAGASRWNKEQCLQVFLYHPIAISHTYTFVQIHTYIQDQDIDIVRLETSGLYYR